MAARKERLMVKEVNAKVEVQPKVGKEQYLAKEVSAKVEVEPKKEMEQILAFGKSTNEDFYVHVDRDVEAEFNNNEEIDVLIVIHKEEIMVVQGLDKKNWILKITRELSEKTFFKGSEMIDKISNRKEKLERNKLHPIVQATLWKNEKFMESTSDERSSDDETPNTTKVVIENVKKTGEKHLRRNQRFENCDH